MAEGPDDVQKGYVGRFFFLLVSLKLFVDGYANIFVVIFCNHGLVTLSDVLRLAKKLPLLPTTEMWLKFITEISIIEMLHIKHKNKNKPFFRPWLKT